MYHFSVFLFAFFLICNCSSLSNCLKIIEFLIVHCMNVLEFVIVPGFVMWGTNPGMS